MLWNKLVTALFECFFNCIFISCIFKNFAQDSKAYHFVYAIFLGVKTDKICGMNHTV